MMNKFIKWAADNSCFLGMLLTRSSCQITKDLPMIKPYVVEVEVEAIVAVIMHLNLGQQMLKNELFQQVE